MSCKVGACAECTQRCIQLHGKKKNLSSVNSFFKIMIDDQFPKVLYLPPKFSATVSTLVDKKVVLEDVIGQQWKVTISNFNGNLAFDEGWSAFSSEHSLEIGDLVIFYHSMHLHFIVRIYTKTGCEKVEFAKKSNLRKRNRDTRTSTVIEIIDKDLSNPQASSASVGSGSNASISQEKCAVTGSENMNVIGEKGQNHQRTDECHRPFLKRENLVAVSQEKCAMTGSENMNVIGEKRINYQSNDECHRPVLKRENFDESYYFINRSKDVGLEENRGPLFDLFSMEMQKNNPSRNENGTNKVAGNKVLPNLAAMSLSTAIDANQCTKAKMVKRENMEILPLHVSDKEAVEKSDSFEAEIMTPVWDKDPCHDKAIRVPFVKSATISVKNVDHFCDTQFKEAKECQNGLATCNMPSPTKHDLDEAVSHEKHAFPTNYCSSAQNEYTPNSPGVQNCLSATGKVSKIVKKEPLEMTPEEDSHEDSIRDNWEFTEKPNKIDGDDNADLVGTTSSSAAYISCLVTEDTPSFLELPTCLPSSTSRGRRSSEMRKLVYLRDPEKRLWPILYLEMRGVQVLTSGWEAFCSANQIQPGDECLFRAEDEFLRKYEVSIRKCKN